MATKDTVRQESQKKLFLLNKQKKPAVTFQEWRK